VVTKKVCWVWIALLLVACDEPASESETKDDLRQRCVERRAQLVEERLDGVTVDREQHRRALTDALGERFIDACLAEVTP
jgi:hypothetical protein